MANYRQIHVSIWKDEWFLELETQEKLFFIYLFSNESASLSGIYKIAMKVMVFETGLDQEYITKVLAKFERDGKVYYSNGIMWIKNMRKYNPGSAKVYNHILHDIGEIPDCELKRQYLAFYAPIPASVPAPKPPEDTQSEARDIQPEETNTISISHEYPMDSITVPDHNISLNDIKDHGAGAPNASEVVPEENGKREKVNTLQVYFLTKTGLPVPKKRKGHETEIRAWQKLWGNPLGEILEWSELDIGQSQTVVDKTIARMRAGGLTISDPNSIIKTARAIWGEMHVSGNGNGAEVPAEEYG